MIKALQVLSEGKHYGKLFFVGENGGTNVLEQDEVISNEELDTLVTRIVPVEQQSGHHVNINVLHPDLLIKLHTLLIQKQAGAQLSDEQLAFLSEHSQLTIRVSGFAVRFFALTKEQREDVITRTFTTKF